VVRVVRLLSTRLHQSTRIGLLSTKLHQSTRLPLSIRAAERHLSTRLHHKVAESRVAMKDVKSILTKGERTSLAALPLRVQVAKKLQSQSKVLLTISHNIVALNPKPHPERDRLLHGMSRLLQSMSDQLLNLTSRLVSIDRE